MSFPNDKVSDTLYPLLSSATTASPKTKPKVMKQRISLRNDGPFGELGARHPYVFLTLTSVCISLVIEAITIDMGNSSISWMAVIIAGLLMFSSIHMCVTYNTKAYRWRMAAIIGAVLGIFTGVAAEFYLQEAWLIEDGKSVGPVSAASAVQHAPGIVSFKAAKVDAESFGSHIVFKYGSDELRVCAAPIQDSSTTVETAVYWAVDENCCTAAVATCSGWNQPWGHASIVRTFEALQEARYNALSRANVDLANASPNAFFVRWTESPELDQKHRLKVGWIIAALGPILAAILTIALL